jgi:hypothetical protein
MHRAYSYLGTVLLLSLFVYVGGVFAGDLHYESYAPTSAGSGLRAQYSLGGYSIDGVLGLGPNTCDPRRGPVSTRFIISASDWNPSLLSPNIQDHGVAGCPNCLCNNG